MIQTQRQAFSPTVHHCTNGITVLFDYIQSVDSCALGVWVPAGTRDEPRGKDGVAHFVEHTAFRGTPKRSALKIARTFDNVGAYSNAYTTKEETCFYVRALREDVPVVLDTLLDLVLNPLHLSKHIEKERSIITEEIISYEDEAEELIFDIAERDMFGDHPLGLPIVGTRESVANISVEDVQTFHSSFYHTSSLLVTVSGNADINSVLRILNTIPKSTTKLKTRKRTIPKVLTRTNTVVYRGVQQSHLLWHVRIGGIHDVLRYPLMLLNVILGDGMSSRLNLRIRENKGLAYSIYSQVQFFVDCGVMSIYAGIDEQQISKVEQLIETEFKALKDKGIKTHELHRAKAQLRASKLMSLESLTARMTMLGKGVLEDGSYEDPYETIQKLESVTVEDIHTSVATIANPETWSRVVILPGVDS